MKLRAEKITLTIDKRTILRDFDLTISSGEMWGILGQNGRGKTTLLHALAGIYPVTEGKILLGNDEINTLATRDIAKHLAILFQDTQFIFPQTVWDYCLAARFPHLDFFQKKLQHDYEITHDALEKMDLISLKEKSITNLSGGEKRRLAIAAVLTQTPQIFLLDELVNHLDIRHQIKTLNYFRHLTQEKSASVVCTLHDMNLAQQFCNRILLMLPDGGILKGSAKELLTADHLSAVYQWPIAENNGQYFLAPS